MRTLFDSTQSQESKYEVGAHEFYAEMRIKIHLDNTLYLSSLWSDLSCAAELVIAEAPAGFHFIPWLTNNNVYNNRTTLLLLEVRTEIEIQQLSTRNLILLGENTLEVLNIPINIH